MLHKFTVRGQICVFLIQIDPQVFTKCQVYKPKNCMSIVFPDLAINWYVQYICTLSINDHINEE